MLPIQIERIFHLLIAFPLVLQEYVQGFRQTHALIGLLNKQELLDIDRVTNRPFYIINRLAKEVRSIADTPIFTSRERERMFKFVDEISNSIGQCERIVQTPVPLTYARHTSRFLTLWCLTLPPCLVSEFGWYIIPFTVIVSWALFGIQEIGMMIEEPFQRALKLEVFANTIRRDLSELLHVTDISLYPLNIDSSELRYDMPVYHKSTENNYNNISGNNITTTSNYRNQENNTAVFGLKCTDSDPY
jgi:predicted membrane chloride channel (bestrophin family)